MISFRDQHLGELITEGFLCLGWAVLLPSQERNSEMSEVGRKASRVAG